MLRLAALMRQIMLYVALATALLAGSPGRAEACVYGGCEGAFAAIGVGVLVVGVGEVALLGADLTYALRGRWLSEELAIANIVVGSLNAIGGALITGLSGTEAGLGWGLGALGAGGLMIFDGVLSLLLLDDGAEAPLGLALAPTQGGASVILRGRL